MSKRGLCDDVPGVIRMDLETWAMLQELTRLRALRLGGDQRDQDAVIRELVRRATKDELRKEREERKQ